MRSPYPAERQTLAPPLLPREVKDLPHGEDWIYEFLWGGERVRAVKHDSSVQLLARDGRDLTNRFPRIAAAVARLRIAEAVLDGEILHLDSYPPHVTRFLAQAVDEPSCGGTALLAFDLLGHEGKDVRQFSLFCRRLLLSSAVQGTPIILSPLIDGNSVEALASAARLGFRGVVAKRAGSPYRPNSLSADWLKTTFAPLPPAEVARLVSRSPFAVGSSTPSPFASVGGVALRS